MPRLLPLAALVLLGCTSTIVVDLRDDDDGGPGGSGAVGGAGGEAPDCEAACNSIDGPCIDGICVDGECQAVPRADGLPCEDGLFCSVDDHCESGSCVAGPPRVCPSSGPCSAAVCDDAGAACSLVPANDGAACDDGNPCSNNGVCSAGDCQPAPNACDALDGECVDGQCQASGCVAIMLADGSPCNDGNGCTATDSCTMGSCIGSGGPVTYFGDDFADNFAGWTLGTEWQIGPATVSTGHMVGNADPGDDHSASADNGVAGVVIGGNPSLGAHDFYWLESPAFDATIDAGPVVLSFYRWLNSDYNPWFVNRIDVWNGTSWVTIWSNGFELLQDGVWTLVSHDITAHRNAAMRVRFGFSVGDVGGAFLMSGWNIDDVLVATASCP